MIKVDTLIYLECFISIFVSYYNFYKFLEEHLWDIFERLVNGEPQIFLEFLKEKGADNSKKKTSKMRFE